VREITTVSLRREGRKGLVGLKRTARSGWGSWKDGKLRRQHVEVKVLGKRRLTQCRSSLSIRGLDLLYRNPSTEGGPPLTRHKFSIRGALGSRRALAKTWPGERTRSARLLLWASCNRRKFSRTQWTARDNYRWRCVRRNVGVQRLIFLCPAKRRKKKKTLTGRRKKNWKGREISWAERRLQRKLRDMTLKEELLGKQISKRSGQKRIPGKLK